MRRFIAAVIVYTILANPARASFESLVGIVQPVVSDFGFVACVTSYSAFYEPQDIAVTLIKLTVAPNAIMESGQPSERNLAVRERIRFDAEQRSDTLLVRVDASSGALPPKGDKKTDWRRPLREEAVAMTLWCGLRNARQAWPNVRFVFYEVIGDTDLVRFGGLYSLETIQPATVRVTWNMEALELLKR